MNSSNWTVGRKLAAGFAIAAFTLLAVAFFGYRSTVHLIENDRLVGHTHDVRMDIADLLSLLEDAETGQRGFVITGDEAYLQPYNEGLAGIEETLGHLRMLTSDNEAQQRRLDAASPLIDSRLAELKLIIDTRRAKGFGPAEKELAGNKGKYFMDQIRQVLADMDAQEREFMAQRAAEAEASGQTTKEAILWGSLLGSALIALMGWLISSALTRQVGSAIGHIQSSSSELQSAAKQQSTGAREQSSSMGEISTSISELLATSRQIAESAQRVARISDETAQAAGKGDQSVQNSQDSILAIRRQVDLIVGHMLEMGKKSQQIGGIVEIINELAEQTNILSINASIEAAGAGEAGRRFAVVADEIRKLADRVGGSSKEIRTLVDEVRAAVNTTVMATEGGAKAAEAGTRQFSELTVAFENILSLVGTSMEAARLIELSTKQQASAVEQLNVAVSNVAQSTRETEAGSSQTLQTAVELSRLSRDLSKLIQPTAMAGG